MYCYYFLSSMSRNGEPSALLAHLNVLNMVYTGGQEFMVPKVLCAIFGNLHSLPFLRLSPLWWNIQNKTGTETLTQ